MALSVHDVSRCCQRLCYVFFVARRKPQNPVSDIINQVGGWLGGSGPGTNPTVARVQSQVKEAARAADAALGGLGQAAVNDARRLSSGSGYVPSETIKAAAVNTAAAAAGYGAAKVAGKAASKVANRVLPAEIGVHHSVAMTGQPFTGTVRGSKAGRSLTAMDQQAGQSYFWTTKGRGGAAKAANEVKFQTEEIAFKYVDFPDESTAMGYVTRIPRGISKADPNLLGSTARQVAGGTQKVIKSVAGTGKPYYAVGKSFTDADAARLANAVRVAKAAEVTKSAAKIGGAAAGVAGAAVVAAKKRGRGGKNKR